MRQVTVCNQKHSGEHPVTMRSLSSPRLKPQSPTPTTPYTLAASPASPAPTQSALAAPPAPSTPPACSTPNTDPVCTLQTKPEDTAAETSRLKKEIERLEKEYQNLLNHTIESDTRLLQFTDQIFAVNTPPRADKSVRASASVDCGVQCEQTFGPPAAVDCSVQCDLLNQITTCTMKRCTENVELLLSLKTTSEVLEAENQYLKEQLKNCECEHVTSKQSWTEIKRKKKTLVTVTAGKREEQPKKTPPPKPIKCTSIPHFKDITVRGDSHSRHIAGLMRKRITSATSVSGVCKPGARLLDIVSPGPPPPETDRSCEVLIAGTNDLAVGEQNNIYRHLEGYITARPAGAELVLASLPYRYDLDPEHPIHKDTVLVNAFIEELAVRYNIRLLRFDAIGRRFFTRHGLHLSMAGKRLLAGMIVECIVSPRPPSARPMRTVQPPGLVKDPPVGATSPATRPAPAAVLGESHTRQQLVTYAEAVRGSPSRGSSSSVDVPCFLETPPAAVGVD